MIDDWQMGETDQPMPITVRVREACRLSGIGRSKLYELISAGEIEIIKVGRITLIPVGALTTYLEEQKTRPHRGVGGGGGGVARRPRFS
jgi:excisionase family DNA binding protein